MAIPNRTRAARPRSILSRRALSQVFVLGLTNVLLLGCTGGDGDDITGESPWRRLVVRGTVTTETGAPISANDHVIVIPGTQDESCAGELVTGGNLEIGTAGTFMTAAEVPGFFPARRCLRVILNSAQWSPWRVDTVFVGPVRLRFADDDFPVDTVTLNLILRKK